MNETNFYERSKKDYLNRGKVQKTIQMQIYWRVSWEKRFLLQ